MQDYDLLYEEAHELLWGDHYAEAIWKGALVKGLIKWGLNGPEIDDVTVDKEGTESEENFLWVVNYMSECYFVPESLDDAIIDSDMFRALALRITDVESRSKKLFCHKDEGDLYKRFMYFVESDPDNNKEDFHKSLAM